MRHNMWLWTGVLVSFALLIVAVAYFKGSSEIELAKRQVKEDEAVTRVKEAFSDVRDQSAKSLPPSMFYTFPSPNGRYVVFTTEGSGLDFIFAARCFEVDFEGNVERTGTYESNPTSSYTLTDVNDLEPSVCKPKALL